MATLWSYFRKVSYDEERYENNPIAMRDAGIAYAIELI